jgi:hypothetical protein
LKYKFTTKNEQQAKRLLLANNLAFVVWELGVNGRSQFKHNENYTAEDLMQHFFTILEEHHINIDELA